MATEKKPWVKDLLVAFAATTLSIILTFGTTGVVNRIKQKQERKLTALMVMSSIEQFARDLEAIEKDTANSDSIATWLLSLPVEDLSESDNELLERAYLTAVNLSPLAHDRTSETIFTSHIDTWKNMGNFKFIDNVGWCFSTVDAIEENYNKTVKEYKTRNDMIVLHPSDFPGSTKMERILRDEEMRELLRTIHGERGYLSYWAACLRADNRNNMRLIGILEKEVMDFTDNLGAADEYEEEILYPVDFRKPNIDVDHVAANLSFARQLDSLRQVKNGIGK